MESIDDTDEDDALAQTLRARCPLPSLNAALPWDTLTEPERQAWRTLGYAALELCGPAPAWHTLAAAMQREVRQQTTDALRRYARHLDNCPESPCSCGLLALLTGGAPSGPSAAS